jgi:hypothetical protein
VNGSQLSTCARWYALIVVGSLVLALPRPAAAHHGAAGFFDETRTVEVKGWVKTWSFVNPHPILSPPV